MPEPNDPPSVSSPPPAAMPPAEPDDPRTRLHELARQLIRSRNHKLMADYLRLRRSIR